MPSLITTGHGIYAEFARNFFKLSAQRGKICTLARICQFIFGLGGLSPDDLRGGPTTAYESLIEVTKQTESRGWHRCGQLHLPFAPVEIPFTPGSLCSTEFAAKLIASLISLERSRV
jgi:hypothetical protein